MVHVDDIQLAATPTEGQRLKAKLEARLSLTTQGPCGPNGKEESVHFLKRKYEYDENGFTIKMGSKYIEKLVQLLNLQDKKARATPELAVLDGKDKELDGTQRSNYATAVGILCTSVLTDRTRNTASGNWPATWSDQQKAIIGSWSTLRAT